MCELGSGNFKLAKVKMNQKKRLATMQAKTPPNEHPAAAFLRSISKAEWAEARAKMPEMISMTREEIIERQKQWPSKPSLPAEQDGQDGARRH